MLRERLSDRLKQAMKVKEPTMVSTVRLILTAVKDRDIAARSKGNVEGISDQEILQVLQTMVRQREEAITLYERGGRSELARCEAEEIDVIRTFLPRQIGASSLKDMGRTMAVLKDRYAGQMDFTKASAVVKAELTGG